MKKVIGVLICLGLMFLFCSALADVEPIKVEVAFDKTEVHAGDVVTASYSATGGDGTYHWAASWSEFTGGQWVQQGGYVYSDGSEGQFTYTVEGVGNAIQLWIYANDKGGRSGFQFAEGVKIKTVSESEKKVISFVERCYNLILGRDADAEGLNNWANQLSSGISNASEIISGFMNSQEFMNQNNSNEETVETLYNTMLGRGSDPDGKAGWVEKLNAGGDSNTVINGFCGSQEFLTICEDYGIKAGTVPTGEKLTGLKGFVERCYTQALGRQSDANGFEYWYSIMENKERTPQEVAAGFVYSAEMNAANKIIENPDALLDSLYKLYLDREADEAGKEYWKQRIAEGMTLDELNNGFAYSAEFNGIVASYGLEE